MNKSPDAFRTISEVADDLDLPQHVLRFWETRFSQIKPMKRGGGRRYYRPDDIDLLRGIKTLLYDEGYTIRGVQRLLKEQGNKFVLSVGKGELPEAVLVPSADAEVSKPALDVSEFEKSFVETPKSKSILQRLTGRGDAPGEIAGEFMLGEEDRKTLQTTLYELLECKRLLDQTRQQ